MAGEGQRLGREPGHRVEREPQHLRQRIIGLAREALGAVVGERHLAEADPRDHPADEARLFGQAQERVERAPAHQPEIAGVERNRRVGHAVEQAIERRRRRFLEERLALARATHGIDYVGFFGRHLRAHFAEQFGRILQIGVDDQYLLPAAQIEPRGQRQLVAVVARQVDRDQPGVARRQLLHDLPAIVLRPVVDQDELIILADFRLRRRGDARVELRQRQRLVIARDDDRERGAVHGRALVVRTAYVIGFRDRRVGGTTRLLLAALQIGAKLRGKARRLFIIRGHVGGLDPRTPP